MLYEIPKSVRKNRNIDDYSFDEFLEEWYYYKKLMNTMKQLILMVYFLNLVSK